jgi:hypothetical protein
VTTKSAVLTIESIEVLVIRDRNGLIQRFCSRCDRQVVVVSLNDAYLSGLSAEAIHQQTANGRFHLVEADDGLSFICLNSLVNAVENREPASPGMLKPKS